MSEDKYRSIFSGQTEIQLAWISNESVFTSRHANNYIAAMVVYQTNPVQTIYRLLRNQ